MKNTLTLDEQQGDVIPVSNEDGEYKELKLVMSTFEDAFVEYVTNKIRGYIETLLIKTDKMINLKIYLKDYPSIVLFDYPAIYGEVYLPLRVSAMDYKGDRFNFAPQKWCLNDELVIEVKGQRNARVEMVIRYG